MKIRLKVVPGASREGIEWLDEEQTILKIRVTSPPEKGKANKAVTRTLARALGIDDKDVAITSGSSSQHKTVDISGLEDAVIKSKLAQL